MEKYQYYFCDDGGINSSEIEILIPVGIDIYYMGMKYIVSGYEVDNDDIIVICNRYDNYTSSLLDRKQFIRDFKLKKY